MNNIADIMIGSVRAQVCGCEYSVQNELSDEELGALYRLSKSQDMAHIVAAELGKQKKLGDGEISAKFKKQQMIAILRYERINYELSEVCALLEAEGIDHIPLKGSVIREYYPEPWMRTSADIDMLVRREELERAKNIICERLGYHTDEVMLEHDISMFSPAGVHLELHFATMEEYCAVNAKAVLERIWDYAYLKEGFAHRYLISDDLFYFYHIAHMAKHFEYGGVGLRFYLDMWLLNGLEHNREKRELLLREGGLLTFEQVASELCGVWFDGKKHNKRTLRMQEHVLGNGIYGSGEGKTAWNQIKKGGKVKHVLSLIFLPYDQMVYRYPSVKKYKILFPLYQVRRWCSTIFHGRSGRLVTIVRANEEVAQNQRGSIEKMLKDLELIP